MYWKRKNKEARARIDAALEDATFNTVKALGKKLDLTPKSRKKTDAIAEILPLLRDANKAVKIFLTLDNLQQKAVAEAVLSEHEKQFREIIRKIGYGVKHD